MVYYNYSKGQKVQMKGIDFMAIVIVANQYGKGIREDIYEFDRNTDISTILGYAINGWAFRIPHEEDRKLWNKILDEDWGELDDCDYYQYNKPIVTDNKWATEEGGYFYDLQTVLNDLRDSIKFLTKIKNIYGGQF